METDMSELVTQLASIEINNEMLNSVNLYEIASNFKINYARLDTLKEFRSEYEKKNWFGRLWNRDSLRDAQMDATQVQADFSKSIGQLMMISILQSKMLSNQQTVLNEQQLSLQAQADHIETHTKDLATQHEGLKEQSVRLENLVRDYFALKGLTDKGAEELIRIAKDVKGTKNDMLTKFDEHVGDLKTLCNRLSQRVDERAAQVDSKVSLAAEKMDRELILVRQEAEAAGKNLASAIRQENEQIHQELCKAANTHREQVANQVNHVFVQIKLAAEQAGAKLIELRQEEEVARKVIASAMHQEIEVVRQEFGIAMDFHQDALGKLSFRVDENLEELSQHTAKIEALGAQVDTQKAKFNRLNWVVGLGTIASIALLTLMLIVFRGH